MIAKWKINWPLAKTEKGEDGEDKCFACGRGHGGECKIIKKGTHNKEGKPWNQSKIGIAYYKLG